MMIHWIVNIVMILVSIPMVVYAVRRAKVLFGVSCGFIIGGNWVLLIIKLADKIITG